jgi:hypothetical protein
VCTVQIKTAALRIISLDFVMALIVAVFGSWFTDAAAEAAAAGVLFVFFPFL